MRRDIDETFGFAVLLPITDDEPERLLNVELTQSIAHIDGAFIFRGFGIDRNAAESFVGTGRNIPFLRRRIGRVAVEKCIANPLLEYQTVILHFARGRGFPDDETANQ